MGQIDEVSMQRAIREVDEAILEAQWQWDKPMREGTGSGFDGRTSSLGFDPHVERRKKIDAILKKYDITLDELLEYCKITENR